MEFQDLQASGEIEFAVGESNEILLTIIMCDTNLCFIPDEFCHCFPEK